MIATLAGRERELFSKDGGIFESLEGLTATIGPSFSPSRTEEKENP